MEILKCDKWENKTLICTAGLPYSGKTTWAKKQDSPIVCPDCIRIALHGHKFIPEAEEFVWAIAKKMVEALFLAGHNTVILDATNTTKERRDHWISSRWATNFHRIPTPKEICIERALSVDDMAIIPIIEKMAESMGYPV